MNQMIWHGMQVFPVFPREVIIDKSWWLPNSLFALVQRLESLSWADVYGLSQICIPWTVCLGREGFR